MEHKCSEVDTSDIWPIPGPWSERLLVFTVPLACPKLTQARTEPTFLFILGHHLERQSSDHYYQYNVVWSSSGTL